MKEELSHKTVLRTTPTIAKKIKEKANKNKRSSNAEINIALERHLKFKNERRDNN